MSFLMNEKGATAIEYGVFTGFAFFSFYVPLSFVFNDISSAAHALIEALTIAWTYYNFGLRFLELKEIIWVA